MAGFSRYAQRELLDHLLKVGAYTPPTNIYVALFNAGPTECTGTAYARELWPYPVSNGQRPCLAGSARRHIITSGYKCSPCADRMIGIPIRFS